MIDQFYLAHNWDPNRYYESGQGGPWSHGKERILQIPQSLSSRDITSNTV